MWGKGSGKDFMSQMNSQQMMESFKMFIDMKGKGKVGIGNDVFNSSDIGWGEGSYDGWGNDESGNISNVDEWSMSGWGKGKSRGKSKGKSKGGKGQVGKKGEGKDSGKKKTEKVTGGINKTKLNNAVLRIVASADFNKDDIQYSIQDVIGGKQCQVTVKCLPNGMSENTYAGEVCHTDKEAIESAALVTLNAIMDDPVLKDLHDNPPEKLDEEGNPKPKKRKADTGPIFLEDSKRMALNNAIQSIVRSGDFTKKNIQYKTTEVVGGFQAQVFIDCLAAGEVSYAGEVCETEREAQENVAGVAFEAIMSDDTLKQPLSHAMKAGVDKLPRPPRQSPPDQPREYPPGKGPRLANKMLLNNAVQKICSANKSVSEHISYVTTEVQGGLQTQVSISCLPNHMADSAFAGEVRDTEKEAINSAAGVALETLMADPELREIHDRPRPVKLAADGLPLDKKKRKRIEAGLEDPPSPLLSITHEPSALQSL